MGLMDGLKSFVRDAVWGGIDDDQRVKYIDKRRAYRKGDQKKQLEIKNGADDNITVNFIGLVVDRAVTMLFGKDVEFDLPGEGDSPEQLFIDATWDANKKSIILQKLATLGAESGTPYVKLIPDGIVGRDGKTYTRLVPQDPKNIEIVTKPDDIDYVERYVIRWTGVRDGKEVQYRQTIKRVENAENWEWITEYKNKNGSNWIPESEDSWEYDFPPMMHWQNLADPLSAYGRPDITDDVIVLQDKLNFAASNIGKILRFYAHPVTVFKGVAAKDVAFEPGKGVFIGADADVKNLETQGDLVSSFNFLQFLQSSLFSITQTVDISSFTDKLGALTNFGLRVLYTDALARLDAKHELYGDALREINRRLLVLSGKGTDGGEVVWNDVLPTNETEQTQALEADKRMGIVSNQTIATERGYVWEDEEERIANDKMKENQGSDNIGAMILNNFNRGGITR